MLDGTWPHDGWIRRIEEKNERRSAASPTHTRVNTDTFTLTP